MTSRDDSGLRRFVEAQRDHDSYAKALDELRQGRKRSHWVWYVLPQLRGLGRSWTADHYGIAGLAEARAYADDPVLGPRLVECVSAILAHRGTPARDILGSTDAMKFRSCLTLFAVAAPEVPEFAEALDAFFDGEPDPLTLELLRARGEI
jgi:uncharacterized protein (DUF1810 family)